MIEHIEPTFSTAIEREDARLFSMQYGDREKPLQFEQRARVLMSELGE
jgi:hypothetical protein